MAELPEPGIGRARVAISRAVPSVEPSSTMMTSNGVAGQGPLDLGHQGRDIAGFVMDRDDDGDGVGLVAAGHWRT